MLRPRGGVGSVLGGWAVERVPEQRAAPATERYGDVVSLVNFFLAALCAVVIVFVSSARDGHVSSADHTPANTQTLAEAPTQGTPASPVAATSHAEPASDQPSRQNAVAQSRSATGRTVPPPERTRRPEPATAIPAESASGVATEALPEATASTFRPLDRISEAAASTSAVDASDRQSVESRIREYVGLAPNQTIPPLFLYTIEAGDTLAGIAERFGLEEATIHFNNFDLYDPNHLVPGETLRLPAIDGVIYTIQPGDNLTAVAQTYLANIDATVAFPGNELPSANHIKAGQTVLLVEGSASLPAAVAGNSGGSTAVAAAWTMPRFRWPLGFDEISDPFGTPRNNRQGFHTGVDFSAEVGTIVGSTAAGQVSFAGWDNSYGYWVEIDHGGGVRSRYAHLSEIWVTTGAWVSAGSFVGTVGNTGNSSGAHLHFEIVMQGAPVDPLALLE